MATAAALSAHRGVLRAAREATVGAGQVAAALLTAPILRGRFNGWGASATEQTAQMPGDGLVPSPKLGYTRAITIDATPEDVWSWLVQIGQGRGGLYSFDALENLVRCDIHSINRVVDSLQTLKVGDLVRLGPEGYPCFRVELLERPRVLVLVGADPKPPHDIPRDPAAGGATWQWLLRPVNDGIGTRLVVRQRLDYPRRQSVTWHLVEPVAFVMERQMLRGIKARAEARTRRQTAAATRA